MSDQLRDHVARSGYSQYQICHELDIDRGTMSRFMAGRVGLSLPTIDRLAEFLDLVLVPRAQRRGR